ncbi:hypothetical protein LZK76_10050 [Rhizobium leguminosarum]|nr:hypothetical protein LZK76_10050 [Rhizobium leguminosarum]
MGRALNQARPATPSLRSRLVSDGFQVRPQGFLGGGAEQQEDAFVRIERQLVADRRRLQCLLQRSLQEQALVLGALLLVPDKDDLAVLPDLEAEPDGSARRDEIIPSQSLEVLPSLAIEDFVLRRAANNFERYESGHHAQDRSGIACIVAALETKGSHDVVGDTDGMHEDGLCGLRLLPFLGPERRSKISA